MGNNKNPPKNWSDWRQCELCRVVQPKGSLDDDMFCVDKVWCEKIRSEKSVHSARPVKENATLSVRSD